MHCRIGPCHAFRNRPDEKRRAAANSPALKDYQEKIRTPQPKCKRTRHWKKTAAERSHAIHAMQSRS